MKSFAQQCDLTRHMNVHSGIKLYTCGTCTRSFTRRVVLLHIWLLFMVVRSDIVVELVRSYSHKKVF
jgi:hypothetical protein